MLRRWIALLGTMPLLAGLLVFAAPTAAADHVNCSVFARTPFLSGNIHVYAKGRGVIDCDRIGDLYIDVQLLRDGEIWRQAERQDRNDRLVAVPEGRAYNCHVYQTKVRAARWSNNFSMHYAKTNVYSTKKTLCN